MPGSCGSPQRRPGIACVGKRNEQVDHPQCRDVGSAPRRRLREHARARSGSSRSRAPTRSPAQRTLATAKTSPAAWPDAAVVEGVRRSRARPPDRRGARRQPDAPARRGAHAQGAGLRRRRSARRSTRRSTRAATSRASGSRRPRSIRRRSAAAGRRTTSSQATLNWEIDFWGKNRSAYESALGRRSAAATVDAEAARLDAGGERRAGLRASCSAHTSSSTSPRRRSTAASRSTR